MFHIGSDTLCVATQKSGDTLAAPLPRTFAYLHHCAGASSMLMTYVLAVLDFFRIEKR